MKNKKRYDKTELTFQPTLVVARNGDNEEDRSYDEEENCLGYYTNNSLTYQHNSIDP